MGGDPRGYTENVPFMYFSLWHWTQLINGYSGFHPPNYFDLAEVIDRFPGDEAVDLLKARATTHVTVNCALYEDLDACPTLLAALDASARFRLLDRAEWEGHPVALYRLIR